MVLAFTCASSTLAATPHAAGTHVVALGSGGGGNDGGNNGHGNGNNGNGHGNGNNGNGHGNGGGARDHGHDPCAKKTPHDHLPPFCQQAPEAPAGLIYPAAGIVTLTLFFAFERRRRHRLRSA